MNDTVVAPCQPVIGTNTERSHESFILLVLIFGASMGAQHSIFIYTSTVPVNGTVLAPPLDTMYSRLPQKAYTPSVDHHASRPVHVL